LIEKSLAGALVTNSYDATGLTCSIELEIASLRDLNLR
jgi:hypothetical protein